VPRERLGSDRVVASDIRAPPAGALGEGPFAYADATRPDHLERLVVEHGITHVIHFSALLSAVGERNPQLALDVNIKSLQIVLELGTHTESVRERERDAQRRLESHTGTHGVLCSLTGRGARRGRGADQRAATTLPCFARPRLARLARAPPRTTRPT
jgi:hypothetical protein